MTIKKLLGYKQQFDRKVESWPPLVSILVVGVITVILAIVIWALLMALRLALSALRAELIIEPALAACFSLT